MKILVILHKDVYNIPMLNLVIEMKNRNHTVDIYAMFMEHIHIRMFDEYELKKYSDLTEEKISEYDIVFSAVTINALPNLLKISRYIFSYTSCVMDEPAGFGDYTFKQRDFNLDLISGYRMESINYFSTLPGKAVGNPKYDTRLNDNILQVEKEILFIDAGHFPFGKKGKLELARCLLDLAKRFKDYRFTIKPRSLPQEGGLSHRNEMHLYDCIDEVCDGNRPENLICLMEHVDLEKLVQKSSLIVCPEMTTTYFEIAAYDKPGLILTGIPTEYTLSHNENHVRRFTEIQKESCLCVYYKEAYKFIPEGKQFEVNHIKNMGINFRDVSKNIVNTMEEIYNKYLSKGIYPLKDNKTTCDFSMVIENRIKKTLIGEVSVYAYRLSEVNFDSLIDDCISEDCYNISLDDFEQKVANIRLKIHETIVKSRMLLSNNPRLQSYYINSLYETNRILDVDEKIILANDMYDCLIGKYCAIKKQDYQEAVKRLKRFLKNTSKNIYEKTLADTPYYKESALYWLGFSLYKINRKKEARNCFIQCNDLANGMHKMAQEYIYKIDSDL